MSNEETLQLLAVFGAISHAARMICIFPEMASTSKLKIKQHSMQHIGAYVKRPLFSKRTEVRLHVCPTHCFDFLLIQHREKWIPKIELDCYATSTHCLHQLRPTQAGELTYLPATPGHTMLALMRLYLTAQRS